MSTSRLPVRWLVALTLAASAGSLLSCGSPSSPIPSPSTVSPVPTAAGGQGSPLTPFGVGSVDLAACLGRVADPACFSGSRFVSRAIAPSAVAPGAPQSLTGTVTGSAGTLNWSAPTSGDPVDTYVLEAGSSPGASDLAVLVTGSTATTYSARGVPPGTYYVRVRAQNSAGRSAASNEVVLVFGAAGCVTAPNQPTGLTVSVSGTTITLTWNAPSGGCAPTSYVLQAGSSSGASNVATFNTGSVATSFTATSVPPGTYFARVLAVNGNGTSGPSNEVSATVAGTAPPGPVTISGTVTDVVSGAPIGGATVSVPATSATTGSDGRYSLSFTGSGQVTVTAKHQGHQIFTQSVALSAATITLDIRMTPVAAVQAAGTWTGTWTNTTFGSTGAITMVIVVDTVTPIQTMTLTVTGSVFGAGTPPVETFSRIPGSAPSGAGSAHSSFYGDMQGTLTSTSSSTANISGSFTNVPQPGISRMDFSGTATATTMSLNYTVTFTGGGTARGVISTTKR